MPQLIRMDIAKGEQEGRTSVSPQSTTTNATASPRMSNKSKIALGYAAFTAAKVYSVGTQELRAGGNEELATTLDNVAIGARIVVGTVATGGLSLIPEAINAGTQAFTTYRKNKRENREREQNRLLAGERVPYGSGAE